MHRLRQSCQNLLFTLLAAAVFLLPAAAYAEEETPAPELASAEHGATETETGHLTDGLIASRVRIAAGTTLVWELPEKSDALRLLWHNAARGVTVQALDDAGEPVGDAYDAEGVYETVFPLESGAASIHIQTSGRDAILSEIEPITAAAAESMLWQEPERVDVLIIAAHTGDETAVFSGLIPSISAKGHTSMTVFISAKSREARQDALDTARAYLQPYAPQFLGEKYLLIAESQKELTYKIWPENTIVAELTALIRQYQPKVVISHAPKGEDEEGMHRMTARMVQQAVLDAENPRRERHSLRTYGTYTVPKLYLHGVPAGEKPRRYSRATPTPAPTASVVLDYTANPAEGFLGSTAMQVAERALEDYRSIRVLNKLAEPVGNYWLIRSMVGEDSGANDLFEHIDPAWLSAGVMDLPTPTPAVTEIPTPLPKPTPSPKAEEAAAETEPQSAEREPPYLTVGVLSAAALAAAVLLKVFVSKKTEKKWLSILVPFLPLLAAAIVAAILLLHPQTEAAAAPVFASPIPTATPLPAEEPSLEPEATLSPAEEKALAWAPYFRSEYDEEEVVVFDEENGHWEYRSDTLSVLIDRKIVPELPLVYYVAHIRMLEDAFRPGFGSLDEAGSAKLEPWKLARRAGAVLAMTGDNLVNDEEWRKGRLIRNGIVYSEGDGQPTLAICPDMTLKVYERGTPTEEILFSGVQNTYGFGPVLVRDGKIAEEECMSHRVKGENPRAGIGMVEAGHYVCIVVDGRQADHSIGATLLEYAQMFIDEGCVIAYNMDGGISSGMIFMGEGIHQHRSSKSKKSSGQRPWADALMFGRSDLVPSEDDPIYSTGNLDEKKPRE